MKKLFFLLVLLLIVGGALAFYFLFFNVSPRDLGIRWTQADHKSGRAKSQIKYETTTEKVAAAQAWQTFGERKVDTTFTSEEISAIMNNKPGAYYPYKDVQVKFNGDGSGEISGRLIKNRLPLYGATFAAPQVAVDFVMKFLPPDPVFYLKGRASLVDNQVGIFEPQRFEIGRIPMPLGLILATVPSLVPQAQAMDLAGMAQELSKVDNKRALIIGFINSRLGMIEGFYAKKAHFTDNKLIYEGTLPEKEVVTE